MNIILETALGLALVYLLVCMLVSGVQEFFACRCNKRGQLLREGLQSLITDRWVYLRTINHPNIVAFYREMPGKGPAPSYLPASAFAQALCDVLIRRHQMQFPGGGEVVFDLDAIKAAVRNAKERGGTLGQALLPLTEGASSLEGALAAIAQWYKLSMERVTGWYKAHTQKRLFIIGLMVAGALNIDSIAIVQALASTPALRAEMAIAAEQVERYRSEVDRLRLPAAEQQTPSVAAEPSQSEPGDTPSLQRQDRLKTYRDQMKDLAAQGLPIGYACLDTETSCHLGDLPNDFKSWLLKIAGLLLTALAAMLGAPFWFDLINRAVSLRGSGGKPNGTVKN